MADDPEAVARAAGYSWDEIDNHLDQAHSEAATWGYGQDEIDSHLGFDPNAVDQVAANLYGDADLPSPSDIGSIDPRGAYADLLRDNAVRGPYSLVDALAGHALSQPNQGGAMLDEIVPQTDAMAAGLPSRRQFIDASLALGGGDAIDYNLVRGNLIDHWQQTGQRPEDAVGEATRNEDLHDRLTAPPRGLAGELVHAGIRGFGELVQGVANLGGTILTPFVSTEFLRGRDAEFKGAMKDFFQDHAKTWDGWSGFVANLPETATQMVGLAATGAARVPLIIYGALHGADAAWRETRSFGGAVMGAAVGALEMGLPIAALRGEAGKAIIQGAIGGALKLGVVGGLGKILDPLPEFAATGHYEAPSPTEIAEGVAGGAIFGGLGGGLGSALAKARNPRVLNIKADGTTETLPLKDVPVRDEIVHEAAIQAVESGKWIEPKIPMEQVAKDLAGKIGELHKLELENRTGALPGEEGGGSTFFQRKLQEMVARGEMTPEDAAKEPDVSDAKLIEAAHAAAHEPLTAGYGAAGGLQHLIDRFVPAGLRSLLTDTEGAATISSALAKLPIQHGGDDYDTVTSAAKRSAAELSAGRRGWAEQFMPFYKEMEPDYREYDKLLQADDRQGMVDSKIGMLKRFMDGEEGITLAPDHPGYGFAKLARVANQTMRAWMEAGDNAAGRAKYYTEHYYKRLYQDADAPELPFGSSLHARTVETWKENILNGRKEWLPHPIENTLHDLGAKLAMVQREAFLKDMTDKGMVSWNASDPGGRTMQIQGVDKIATGTREIAVPNTDLDLTPGSPRLPPNIVTQTHEMPLHAYTNPELAKVFNNWASNFQKIPLKAPTLTKLRYLGNTMQSLNLLGGLYHGITETQAFATTGLGVIAKDIADITSLPGHLADLVRGNTLADKMAELGRQTPEGRAAMYAADPILDAVMGAGYRAGPRQEIYRPGNLPGLYESIWTRGSFGRELREGLKPYNMPGFAASMVSRLAQSVSAPLFDHLIPRIKAGAVMSQMRQWIDHHPTASHDQLMRAARQIVDNTDDRMGELNMNNVFWKKWVKDTAQTSMISTSWVYGTVRQTAAAFGWRFRPASGGITFEVNPFAMLNLAATLTVAAGTGSIYQWLHTGTLPGQGPRDLSGIPPWLHDLVAPRTGGYTKHGAPARAILPGEQKEYYDWMKVLENTAAVYAAPHGGIGPASMAATSGALGYAEGKLRSSIRVAITLATGKDPIGHEVAYTPSGISHVLMSAFLPLMISNWENYRPKSGITELETLFGARELPDWITDPLRAQATQNWLTNKKWRDEMRRYRTEQRYLLP